MTTLSRGKDWGICIHWTAGNANVVSHDKKFYHYIFDAKGIMHKGNCDPEDNINCNDGKYAAHIAQANTKTIGLSLAGGPAKFKHGEITEIALEALCYKAAELSIKFNIPVEKEYVFTHYEFGLANPNTGNRGKIDINNLPFEKSLKPSEVGDYIRNKIKWYRNEILNPGKVELPPTPDIDNNENTGERFSKAFDALMSGNKIKRKGWKYFVSLKDKNDLSEGIVSIVENKKIKDVSSFNSSDILANDWEIAK